MKIKTNNNFSKDFKSPAEKIILDELQENILIKAAENLRKELINEINLSDLQSEESQNLIEALEIEKIGPAKVVLKINNQNIKTIEYGTQEQDENPIMLRAKTKSKETLNQIIQAELTKLNN